MVSVRIDLLKGTEMTNLTDIPNLTGDLTDLTPSQEKAVVEFWEFVKELDFYADDYEVKEFKVEKQARRTISISSEVGLKNDEGTAAELFGRDRRYIFVGPRGGFVAYDSVSLKRFTGRDALFGSRMKRTFGLPSEI